MPELNYDAPGAGAADLFWPELAAPGNGPDSSNPDSGVTDPAVRTILDQVREVPGLPVSEHPAAYAGMHDALLEALNEEPRHEERHEEPRPGPGAA
ncbi:hypothetical protein ACFVTE_12980 [Arthrobacter sp. NPDC058097]|uniref:hypothetical protein n=1 Tax=Arthrobacter sp. NPDC058097 TaxID=3346340 RepID=UPI0036DFA34A